VSRTFVDPAERYFEDFELGDVVHTRGRTVESADFTAFAGVVGNHYPLHTDEEFGRATRFGSRIGHGSFTLSLAIGLVSMTGYLGDAVVAQLEIAGMRALKPVLPGDTLRVRAEVTARETEQASSQGRLEIRYTVLNQADEDVMVFDQAMLVHRRPSDTAARREAASAAVTGTRESQEEQ
jgi:3-hydroxybutyryl-CoA dehydratase